MGNGTRWTVVLLAAAVLGCQSTPKSAPAAKQAAPPDLAPSLGISTVAFLDVANITDDNHAGEKMAALLESMIKSESSYNFFGIYETASLAGRDAAAGADLARLRSDWKSTRKLDPAIITRFGKAAGVQGVLAGELLAWTSHKLDWNVEGKSYSRVTCKLTLFETATGTPVWSQTEDKMLESANYDPSSSGLGDQSGVPTTEIVNRAPDPPPIDEAARQTAERLARDLTKAKGAK